MSNAAKNLISTILSVASEKTGAFRLADVRPLFPGVSHSELDRALLAAQDAKLLTLYREDFRPSQADQDAALMTGGKPRHIGYLSI